MPKETATEETQEQETTETQETQKTAAEIAAEERATAAEQKAAEKEAEVDRLKEESRRAAQPKTPNGYSISSFSDAEWSDAEASTGLDRKQILVNLNMKAQTEGRINQATAKLEAKLDTQRAKESMAADDPLYPKYRKEVDKFLSDIPEEFLLTEEGRKKWLTKAFSFGKNSVKIAPSSRRADTMDTKESGTVKEKGNSSDFSDEEKRAIESNGKTVEDYNKIKHPFLKDGIMIKDRPEPPRFGPK